MDSRKLQILRAIIEQFVETAEPIGSKTILLSYQLQVSPATVRNDMAQLEEEGLIMQPHTSAGRVPTELGYRIYIDELADFAKAKKLALNYVTSLRQEYYHEKIKQKIFNSVSFLARTTDNMSFATLPDNQRTFYIGVSNILKKPEFQKQPMKASEIIEVIEDESHFLNHLRHAEIDRRIKIFIGNENAIPQIASCGIIVTSYNLHGEEGYIGILGPKRLNYPFNAVILEEVRNMMEE